MNPSWAPFGMRFLRALFCGIVFLLASCATHYTLSSPGQLAQLPVNRGMNGGSLVADSPWEYRGSSPDAHEFYYYFNIGNMLQRRRVTIPRASAVLHFREFSFGSMPRDSRRPWVTLHPGAARFEFYPLPHNY